MTGFPWFAHRTLAEVIETEVLKDKAIWSSRQMSTKEFERLRSLMIREYEANFPKDPGDGRPAA